MIRNYLLLGLGIFAAGLLAVLRIQSVQLESTKNKLRAQIVKNKIAKQQAADREKIIDEERDVVQQADIPADDITLDDLNRRVRNENDSSP